MYNSLDMKGKYFLLCGLSVFTVLFYCIGNDCIYIGVALSTALYHITIRLAILWAVKKCDIKTESGYFRQKKREMKFYRFIKLATIKNLLPAYYYVAAKKDILKAIKATCITEVTNAIIIPLDLLPLIISLLSKSGLEYIIPLGTVSLIMGLVDIIMLFSQRYNRFRMLDVKPRLQSRCQ